VLAVDTLKNVKPDSIAQSSMLESKIEYKANDSIVFLGPERLLFLYGQANVLYENMNMTAEVIEIDYNNNLITAYGLPDSTGKLQGNPVFKDDGEEMSAERIMFNLKTKKGKIYNALTKQGELLVFGAEIKRDSNNVIYMKGMKCIPCEHADSRTVFRATRAKIIPNDKIVTGPMYLEIAGVPTPLGLPFGYFPNTKKRANGVLMPTFGNSPNQGFNLREGGFYWGISDKTDMVVRGDIYSNGSWAVRTTNNYLLLYKSAGALNLGYSQFNIGDKDVPATFKKQSSYSINWQHRQDNKNNPKVNFGANVNYQNARYNTFNAINTGEYLTNTFQSNINYSRTFKIGSLSSNATHNQNNNTRITEISFPQLTFNVNRFFPFKRENAVRQNVFDKIGVNYLFEARNTLSGVDSTLFKGDIEKKMKYGVRHSLPISTNFNLFKYITVTPALNLTSVMYTRSVRKEFLTDLSPAGRLVTDTVNGFVAGYDANFSTALNTKVFFDYMYKRGKVRQIRHLLIPTLTYVYRPDLGEEQYGFWKKVQTDTFGRSTNYSIFDGSLFGGPAAGKQNSLNFNLNNNIEAKVRQQTDTGVTYKKVVLLQNMGITGGVNFALDSFQVNPIGITARNKVWKFFDLVAGANFDPYGYRMDTETKRVHRVSQFAWNYNNTALVMQNANVAVNASFGSNDLVVKERAKQSPDLTNAAERGVKVDMKEQEKLQWNLSVFYNLTFSYDNNNMRKLNTLQTMNFSGDISPTKNWKLGVTSGFDFVNKQISYTSFDIYRDLKCWEARINWVPFGFRKSYNLTINLKTAMLSDFKIPRQRQWFDNF